MEIAIRKIREVDYRKVSQVIGLNFREVNIKDYSEEKMEEYCKVFTPEKIEKIASMANMYVATSNKEVIGCGAIHSYWGKEDESVLRAIFIKPELQGKGIGQKIIAEIEKDECYTRAKRIEVASSITAYEFYRKMGYQDKEGVKRLNNKGHYHLEKFK